MMKLYSSKFLSLAILLSLGLLQFACGSQSSRDSGLLSGNDTEGSGGSTSNSINRFVNFDLKETALILYNQNSNDSLEIASYYSSQREIDSKFLCGVKAPLGEFMSHTQLQGVRKQIIEDCLCEILEPSERPNPCNSQNIDEIAKASKIGTLVYIQGVPLRLYDTGWDVSTCTNVSAEDEDPLVDFVLSRTLFNEAALFDPHLAISAARINEFNSQLEESETPLSLLPQILTYSYDHHVNTHGLNFPREISAFYDQRLAYGRIQALDVPRAKALIDRTIASERNGFTGHIALGLKAKTPSNNAQTPVEPYLPNWTPLHFFQELLQGHRSVECEDYLLSDSEYWDPELCKVAANPLGHIPGEAAGKIQEVRNVSLFLGGEYAGNNQRPFDGELENLLRWKKSSESCVGLCRDFSTEIERENCRASSLDYFKEINTACIGGGDGLMGWQYRSWTATTYALNPLGWEGTVSGDEERTGIKIINTGGFQNDRFQDSSFVRWGHREVAPTCVDQNLEEYDCAERLAIRFQRVNNLSSSLDLSEVQRFRLKFRYRNAGQQTPDFNPKLHLTLKLWGSSQWHQPHKTLDLHEAHDEWTEAEFLFETNPANRPENLQSINRVQIWFRARHSEQMEGYFDLDAVELERLDENLNVVEDVLSTDYGSFSSNESEKLPHGEWPATIIDRLGGIGYWGSANHHKTCGHAFSGSTSSMRFFFAGRSLGESLTLHESGATSGFVFADPLYRPSAAFIYYDDQKKLGITKEHPARIDPTDFFYLGKNLKVNALHGSEKLESTRFEIRLCHHFENECQGDLIFEHEGAAYGYSIPVKAQALLISEAASTPVQLQLKVWNPGEESDAIFSRVFFEVKPEPEAPLQIDPDLNLDGIVDGLDLTIFINLYAAEDPSVDFNQDGLVNSIDYTLFLSAWSENDSEKRGE